MQYFNLLGHLVEVGLNFSVDVHSASVVLGKALTPPSLAGIDSLGPGHFLKQFRRETHETVVQGLGYVLMELLSMLC